MKGASLVEEDLLSAQEVAHLLGVGQVTVWRWCREQKLPCVKVGEHWRMRRGDLDEFLSRSENSVELVGKLDSFVGVPDNLLAIAQNRELLHRLDAAFFRVGEARGGMLVKYLHRGAESPTIEALREELEGKRLGVGRLEEEGRLHFIAESGEPGERENELRRLVANTSRESRPIWVNFNWEEGLDLGAALAQQQVLSELVEDGQLVTKTSVLEDELDEWAGATQRRAQAMHAGTVWLSESGLALSRVEPSPAV
jgi:excisionase family DNA binding protein